nr:RNA-directed DNA polymerase, eukaryota [Tanacetum cinerariifolium]
MVDDDDETSKDKEIDKLMALISLSFNKIYKPTNNNLRTSSNTSHANQDNSLKINRNVGYESQRIGTVAGARETVGSSMVQKSGIQCYNYKEFRHVSRECQKPKRAKDATYHREKMLLCMQEEAGIQLNAEQADWKDDTDDESDDQELKAHYMYMAKVQEVSPDTVDSGPIFDTGPEQKNDEDADLAKERELLASLIEKLKCEIDESKNHNKFLETSNKKSRIKRYINTKPNRELIHYCLEHPPYELGWKEKPILDAEGIPTNSTDKVFETYKNVTHEIRDQLNAEAEAVQIILTGIDNDIYSIVDACPNASEMWKAIERLKQGWVSNFLDDSDDEGESEEGVNEHDPLEHEDRSCGDNNEVNEVKYPSGFTLENDIRVFNLSEEKDTNANVADSKQGKDAEIPEEQNDICNVNGPISQDSVSVCSGKFKKSMAPKSGGFILCLMEELVRDYLIHVPNKWDGKIVIMGDFNKVRFKSDRFGSVFNVCGAEVFNSFIANAGLVEVPLGGSAFTWCHKSASKMSKIDRIAPRDKSNALRNLMYTLKFLKLKIRGWINMNKNTTTAEISRLKVELADLDEIINNGNGTDETVNNRAEILNSIHKLHQIQSTKEAQKAKIKWSVEGDGNVCLFHGIINKKRSQQNIRGVMVDGKWIEEPSRVKNQIFQYFKDRFDKPKHDRIDINMSYPRSL